MTDSEGVYFLLKQYDSQLQDALRAPVPSVEYRNVQRVVVCGMGGSGVVGDFVKALVGRVVVEVVKGYSLPDWVGHHDLVVCVSYSGNTEETLTCFAAARKRGALTVVVTSGGKLFSQARDGAVPVCRVPSGLPPRFATVHMLVPLLGVLQELAISEAVQDIPGNVLVDEKFCRSVATRLVGHTPLVYASTQNMVLSEKLKTDINENAKVPAFYNVFPEANHNELNSYEHITPNYAVVFLRDPHDNERVVRRMDGAKGILEERHVRVINIPLSERSVAYKLLQGNLQGLLISYFLAMAYGIDPGPVNLIERFKKTIAQER